MLDGALIEDEPRTEDPGDVKTLEKDEKSEVDEKASKGVVVELAEMVTGSGNEGRLVDETAEIDVELMAVDVVSGKLGIERLEEVADSADWADWMADIMLFFMAETSTEGGPGTGGKVGSGGLGIGGPSIDEVCDREVDEELVVASEVRVSEMTLTVFDPTMIHLLASVKGSDDDDDDNDVVESHDDDDDDGLPSTIPVNSVLLLGLLVDLELDSTLELKRALELELSLDARLWSIASRSVVDCRTVEERLVSDDEDSWIVDDVSTVLFKTWRFTARGNRNAGRSVTVGWGRA